MVFVGLLSWWYSAGLRRQLVLIREQLGSLFDYFSIDLLLKTLASPFRQISAGHVSGPIGVQLQAFFDRLVSRIIGIIVRSFMIIIGVGVLIVFSFICLLRCVGWIMLPSVPLIGMVLTLIGWVPSWT